MFCDLKKQVPIYTDTEHARDNMAVQFHGCYSEESVGALQADLSAVVAPGDFRIHPYSVRTCSYACLCDIIDTLPTFICNIILILSVRHS